MHHDRKALGFFHVNNRSWNGLVAGLAIIAVYSPLLLMQVNIDALNNWKQARASGSAGCLH